MSHLVAVTEQIHRALDRCTSARQAMKSASEPLEEAPDLLGLAALAEEGVHAYLSGLIGAGRTADEHAEWM